MRTAIRLVLFLLVARIACQGERVEQQKAWEEIETIDEFQFQKLIRERNGRALLVNVWASWCVPCREEFPDLVRLAKKYRNKPVDVIGISADYPDELETKVRPFLKAQKVNFANYIQNFESDEAFINMLNEKWSGALPATFLFNAQGEQVDFFQGRFDYKKMKSLLDKVLSGEDNE